MAVVGFCTVLSSTAVSATAPKPGESFPLPLNDAVALHFTWVAEMNLWVGTYEVTNAQFHVFNPEHDSGSYLGRSLNAPDQPVVRVNFHDVTAFCAWLTERERVAGRLPAGWEYRLPSGDEWTAFARCGTMRTFPWGEDLPPDFGNYSNQIVGYDAGAGMTVAITASGRNEWGLYGVGGNVWEWTSESDGNAFMLRGASWDDYDAFSLRIECRVPFKPFISTSDAGFRVVLGPVRPQ